jgi:NADH-quinone oxidoreductase subunit M
MESILPIILYLLFLLPILAAGAIGLGAPARPVALGISTIGVFLVALLCRYFDPMLASQGVFQFTHSIPVLDEPQLALAVGLDGMSLVMVVLSSIVLLAALWMVDEKAAHARLHYAGSLLIGAGAIGAFVSTDMLFFYAFHELALIPTFLLIGLAGRGGHARRAAWRITIYLGAGSMVLLVGLIALFHYTGGESFAMADMLERASGDPIPQEIQGPIALLLLVGFGTLVSLVPFHSWAAPAYAAAPTPVAMLHAGVLKKFGLYGLLRLAIPMLPHGMREWVWLLLVLLILNILYMGFVTIAQKRLDTMLGTSSVMHMGYIFLGVAALSLAGDETTTAFAANPEAGAGAILLMFAHGIGIALLFALADRVENRTGTLEFSALGGLGRSIPTLGFLFGLAAMASIGLPGLANFPGELLIFLGGFKDFEPGQGLQPLQWTTIAAVWGVVISAVYMLRAYRKVFMAGPEDAARLAPLTLEEKLPLVMLAATLVFVGFFPNLILQYLAF